MALVFLLSGAGETFGVHLCPQHDLVGHTGGHGADSSDTGLHQHDAPSEPSDSQTGHEHCTCLGVCPTSAAADVPAAGASTIEVAFEIVPRVPVAPVDVVLPRLAPFFLPYSQAPPLLG